MTAADLLPVLECAQRRLVQRIVDLEGLPSLSTEQYGELIAACRAVLEISDLARRVRGEGCEPGAAGEKS